MTSPETCPSCSERVPPGSRFCQACGSEVKPRRQPHKVRQPEKQRSRSLPQSALFMAGALVIVLLTGLAIGGMTWARSREKHVTKAQQPAQVPLMVEGAGPMPGWLASADPMLIADYTWAAEHHDELQYFPCFCGCYESVGHVSNSECYYKRGADKRIVAFDQHAYG